MGTQCWKQHYQWPKPSKGVPVKGWLRPLGKCSRLPTKVVSAELSNLWKQLVPDGAMNITYHHPIWLLDLFI